MNWKLNESGESIGTYVDLSGSMAVCGIVFQSITNKKFTYMVWLLDYKAPPGTDYLANAIRQENFTTPFTAIKAAEKAIGLKVDEIQSSSAIWQEV